jgi:predicted CXXCH cytochrome family protein
VITLAALLLWLTGAARDQSEDPHGREDGCDACHDGAPPEGVEPPVNGRNGHGAALLVRYPLARRETAVCTRCHRYDRKQAHPVEVEPTLSVPAGWPLGQRGRLVCSTCHDPHVPVGSGRGGSAFLLRADSVGEEFCLRCHERADSHDLAAQHVLAVETSHRAEPVSRARASGVIDAYSARCLACHDGTTASDVRNSPPETRFGLALTKTHPIGMEYPLISQKDAKRGRFRLLRDRAQLDPRIRLFDGRVGCGSCHNPYLRTDGFLVISMRGAELCKTCHEIKGMGSR